MKYFKFIIAALLISSIGVAAGKLQNSDFASSADITGAGGTVSQLLNTSKIYDNVNAQVLNTTLAAKMSNPMTTAEDLIKGGASGAPTRLAVGSNGQCLIVSGGAIAWGACGTSSPLTTKGDLYTYDTGNARLPVGTDGQVLTADSGEATGLKWETLGSGSGDVVGPASSVDGEIALFDSTTGKLLKRATGTGVCKTTSGVFSVGSVDLASEVTGVLPLVNGGSAKNMTAVNGGIVWTDADSMEVSAAGTAGQFLQSNGAAAPSWASAPNPSAVVKAINQSSHGFSVGDIVYYTGSAYAKAKADVDSTSEVLGVVSAVADANNFTMLTSGYVSGLSGLTAGTTYYLSSGTAGAVTSTEPTASGQVSKPVYVAVSTTEAFMLNSRGAVIGSSTSGGIGTWTQYTPTTVGFGTISGVEVFYRREGDSLRVRGKWVNGTVTASTIQIGLPSGLSIDFTKIPTASTARLGTAAQLPNGSASFIYTNNFVVFSDGSDASNVYVASGYGSNALAKAAGSAIVNSSPEVFNLEFIVPISGW